LQHGVVRLAGGIRQRRLDVIGLKIGKVLKIFCSVTPSANIPSTSVTRTRKPRMQGRPPHLPGSIVMRSNSFMVKPCTSREKKSSAVNFGREIDRQNWTYPNPALVEYLLGHATP
jgi:hypothetical protein